MTQWLVLLLSSCNLALASVRCVFLHGTGVLDTSPASDTDTTGYWGGPKIIRSTPYCDSRHFVHQDTTHRGWDNDDLQQSFCDLAVGQGSANKSIANGAIEDAIVFTHSMGNLVFTGALMSERCHLGSNAKWYSMNGPWRGSKAVPWVTDLCSNISTHSAALQWLAHELNYCVGPTGGVAKGYLSMSPSYPGLWMLRTVADSMVSGALCGTSGFGLVSQYSAGLQALDSIVPFTSESDGMVGIDSCRLPNKTYHGNFAFPYYEAMVNHADGTCQDGDGDFGVASRQPCQWIAQRGPHDDDAVLV